MRSLKVFTAYLPEQWENPPGADYLPFDDFVGVDSSSDIYVWGQNAQTVELRKFNYNLKQQLTYSSSLDYGSDKYDHPKFLSLTANGFMYLASYEYDLPQIVSIHAEVVSGFLSWLDGFSIALVVLSFLVTVLLSIKHCWLGADPVGWNRRKLCDVFFIVLLTIGLILVTLFSCLEQVKSVNQIESNTVMFDSDLEKFYQESLIPCSNFTATSSPVGLCTCDDESNQFQNSSCVSSVCLNSVAMPCASYLQDTCDCSRSMYQWECTCDYLLDNNCSANVTSVAKINPAAESGWKYCQKHFDTPTNLLNVNFYLLIVSASVITFLQMLNIIRKLDSTVIDVLATVASLLFTVTQFLVIMIGYIYVGKASDDCLQHVLGELPGCVLSSQATNYIEMQSEAVVNLRKAYSDLFKFPVLFLLSMIPDLWTLFYTVRNLIKKRKYREL